MSTLVLCSDSRARALEKPRTFDELTNQARNIFGFKRDATPNLFFSYLLRTRGVIEAELDPSAYHLVEDGASLHCVIGNPERNGT